MTVAEGLSDLGPEEQELSWASSVTAEMTEKKVAVDVAAESVLAVVFVQGVKEI